MDDKKKNYNKKTPLDIGLDYEKIKICVENGGEISDISKITGLSSSQILNLYHSDEKLNLAFQTGLIARNNKRC
jgi:hypothetical protein